ncbi:MAG: hypothetical protein JRJ68_03305 [Deltaproteobacteria bacterium]|nr:hypothetical protein [Deltaproteobacteria bacterium]
MNTEEREAIIEAMQTAGGHVETAAELLECSVEKLRKAISNDVRLASVYGTSPEDTVPRVNPVVVREPDPEKDADENVMALLNQESMTLTMQGFKEAGIPQETITKLETLGKFEPVAGKFLVGSMTLFHRLITYCGMELVEDLDRIREELRNENLSIRERLMWQRAYNLTYDQLLKANRDVQSGTLAMAKISKKKGNDDKPVLPAFQQLKPDSSSGT